MTCRMRLVCASLLFVAFSTSLSAQESPRSKFSVRFEENRSSFQPGEPIRIELVFDPPSGINPDAREGPFGWASAEAVLDHEDGVATPLRPLAEPFVRNE